METWKEIWERHSADLSGKDDLKSLVMELKRANGFDVTGDDGISADVWLRHMTALMQHFGGRVESLYEVGCGSGANLVLAAYLSVGRIGGCDYSYSLVKAAREATRSSDIICSDAAEFPEEPKYEAVIIDSVVQYFPSLDYTEGVLKRMKSKADRFMAVLDVFDSSLKNEWMAHRRAVIPDYDRRYGSLDQDKLFIDRDWLRSFSEQNGLEVTFYDNDIEGYWNGQYTYNAVIYKK